jgi:hypothetical protein
MLRDNVTVQRVFKKVGFRLRRLADPSSVSASAVLDLWLLCCRLIYCNYGHASFHLKN